jgi:ABC-2 type transport system ATP-binding protein
MLQLEGVTKRFTDVLAVDRLSLTVPPGVILGFLGPNGSGKTTTMRMILDILRPDEGSISWRGAPIDEKTRRRFGYLPEERGLYPKMRIGEQLLFFARLFGMEKSEGEQAVRAGLQTFGLSERDHSRLDELSRGNQQKVQVLAAIQHKPELVLLDEPFTGLDPANSDLLEQALGELRDGGSTIIFSSHRLEQVEELCDEVAIISSGRLRLAGKVDDLRDAATKRVLHVRVKGGGDPKLVGLPLRPLEHARDYRRYALEPGADPHLVMAELAAREQVELLALERASIKEIFLEVTSDEPGQLEAAEALQAPTRAGEAVSASRGEAGS